MGTRFIISSSVRKDESQLPLMHTFCLVAVCIGLHVDQLGVDAAGLGSPLKEEDANGFTSDVSLSCMLVQRLSLGTSVHHHRMEKVRQCRHL